MKQSSNRIIILFALVVVLGYGQYAQARGGKGGRIGYTSGVVYTKDSDSTLRNPANLKFIKKEIKLHSGFGDSVDSVNINAAYVGASKKVGFGLEALYITTPPITAGPLTISPDPTIGGGAGVAFGSSKVGIGANVVYLSGGLADIFDTNLAFAFGGRNGFGLAAGITNLLEDGGARTIVSGLGYRKAGSFYTEVDANINITASTFNMSAGFGIELAKGKFTIGAEYAFDPSKIGDGSARAGLGFWMAKNISLDGSYAFGLGTGSANGNNLAEIEAGISIGM